MTPAWISEVLAALMLAVAAVSAARLAAAQPWRRGSVIIDTDVAHLLMAIAMAGVLASGLRTLPDEAWELIFGLMIGWFAVRVARDARSSGVRALAGGHCGPHLVHSGAMLYMFLGMTSSSAAMAGMPGMAAGSSSMLMLTDPTLAFVFALTLIGYSVWDLDQLSGRRYSLTAAPVTLVVARVRVPAMAGAEPARAAVPSGPGSAASGELPAADGELAAAGGGSVIAARHVAGGALGRFLLSPAVTIGSRVIMGVVMTFMLLTAL